MAIDCDVVVVGAGPAGIEAAVAAASQGLGVIAIDGRAPGGRATWQTQVQLRTLERELGEGNKRTLREPEWRALRTRMRDRARVWGERGRLRLEDAGVQILAGRASFLSSDTLVVGDQSVRFDRAVLAIGGEPRALPGLGFDGQRVLRPGDLMGLATLPRRAIVIGGDAGGAELADALHTMGVEVSWLMDDFGILPSFDRELAEVAGDVLMERGVRLVHGKPAIALAEHGTGARATVEGGRTYDADAVFLAIGSQLELADLALDRVGVSLSNELIGADTSGTTSAANVLAAGECTGLTFDVASARAMGRVAGLRAAGVECPAFEPRLSVRCAHIHPALAQIGLSPERAAGREVSIRTLRFDETLSGVLRGIGESDHARGVVHVVFDENGRIAGGSALGSGAPDLMAAVGLAMRLNADASTLAHWCAPEPSVLGMLARALC